MGLQGFRDQKNSGIIVVIFVVIIFVFIFMFGLPSTDILGGGGSKSVAKVGNHEIDSALLKSMILRHYDDHVFQTDDLPAVQHEVVYNLATVFILADEARNAGLRVSEEEWTNYLTNYEAGNEDVIQFLKNNKFVQKRYENAISRYQMSSREYREYKENELLARNYLTVLQNSIAVSDDELWALFAEKANAAELDVIHLSHDTVKSVLPEATEKQINDYAAMNASQIQEYYDDNIVLFSTPMKMKLQQIIIQKGYSKLTNVGAKTVKTLADSERFEIAKKQALTENADFAQVFADYDESEFKLPEGIDLLAPVEKMDSKIQMALLGKNVGDIIAVELDDQYVIAKVLEKVEKVVTPLDDVKLDIAKKLYEQNVVKDKTKQVADNILNELKYGKTLDEALENSLYAGVLEDYPTVPEVVVDPEVFADAAEAPAPVVVEPKYDKDVIVIPKSARLTVDHIKNVTMDSAFVTGVGSSDELMRAIRAAQPGEQLQQSYEINNDTFIIRVAAKQDASRVLFDANKEQMRSVIIQQRTLQLIGNPNEVLNLRGGQGIWLQQKVKDAQTNGVFVENNDYFAKQAAARAERKRKAAEQE